MNQQPSEENDMSIGAKERPSPEAPAAESGGRKERKRAKKGRHYQKRTMNLYYKPDRTTKPATIALYVLFVLTCMLGLGKFLVYDIWMETVQAQQTLAATEEQLSGIMAELADYNEVKARYSRYSATEEERALIDRMEVLALLDEAVGATANMETISISGDTAQIQFSGVTLAQTAQIVNALEASPIVAGTVVNTASTSDGQEKTDPNDASAPVRAYVLIQLQKEVAE